MIQMRRAYGDEPSPDGGNINSVPPNLKELSEEEFAKSSFFSYTPETMEHRQVPLKNSKGKEEFTLIRIFWMEDGQCFVFANDYWAGKVRVFRGAICDHEYRELSEETCRHFGIYHGGRCFHVSKCIECGRVESYDSSD